MARALCPLRRLLVGADDAIVEGGGVETIEERVAFLEGRVGEHSRMIDGIRAALVSLEQRMDRRFEAVDRRFEAVDRRFDALEQRFTALEDKIDRRFATTDRQIARQFIWVVGVQVTTFAALVAAILGAVLVR
jgi:uncharacterized coiled-coil protein SlyX